MKILLKALGLFRRPNQPVSVTAGFRKNREWISSVDHDEYGTWYFQDHVYDAEVKKWADGMEAFLASGGAFKDYTVPAPDAGYAEIDLSELLAAEPSLEALTRELPKGWMAERSSPDGEWKKEIDETAQFTDRKAAVG